jgi:AraC-like DNA-binding protein
MSEASYPKVYLYQRIVKAKLYIDAHYRESIDLSNISDEAYFSKFHFIRTFKRIYGSTPHQYLTTVRIAAAKGLLKKGETVSAVCYEVGFESLTSFSGLFKKLNGVTPSEFQQREMELQGRLQAAPQKFIPGCFGHALGYLRNSNFQEAAM